MKRKPHAEHHKSMDGTVSVGHSGPAENGALRHGISPQNRSDMEHAYQSPEEENRI
jgi:hypothetical protein